MTQNKGILSLLDDDDDDDEDMEDEGGANNPQTIAHQQKPHWPENDTYPKGTLARLPPLQVAKQPPQTQPAAAPAPRPSQGSQINLQLLLDFCKLKFPPEEYKAILKDFMGFKAQKIDSREMLSKIRTRIGPEVIQQFSAQIRSAAANGQNSASTQAQLQQQARHAGQPQHLSSQPGASIMQSLKYNAEQNRQQRGGGLPPDIQPAFSRPLQPTDHIRGFPQQLPHSGGRPRPLLPSTASQQRPQLPASAAASSERSTEQRQQPRPVLPTFLGKQPQGPQQPQPAAKRARKEKEDIEDENDILKDSGINLEEEQNALLGNLKGAAEIPTLPRSQPAAAAAENTFLNLSPLQVKVLDIARRHGLESVDQQVGQLISKALETHLGSLISQLFAMTRQRTDSDRARPGMVLTGNLRRKLHEINARDAEEQKGQGAQAAKVQQAATSKKKQAAEEAKKSDRASLKESDKQQASAANAAAAAAFGSKAQKWGAWSTSAAKNPMAASQSSTATAVKSDAAASDSIPGPSDKATEQKQEDTDPARPSSAARTADANQKSGFLPPSRVKAEMLSAKLPDLIAVLENHYMYQKSSLLYKLYDLLTD